MDQIHSVVNVVQRKFGKKNFYSFWVQKNHSIKHMQQRLLYKIKCKLSVHYYLLIKPYLTKRYFQESFNYENSNICPIRSEVPHDSVPGSVFYQIYTTNFPLNFSATTQLRLRITHIITLCKQVIELSEWYKYWKIKIKPNVYVRNSNINNNAQ